MPAEPAPAYPAWRAALSDTAAVGFGLFPLGVAFGMLLVQSGFAWWWAPVFSLTIYAGSLEFLAVGLLLAATPLASIAVTTFLVNFRHVFYALSFPLHEVRGPLRRLYAMYALTDETYAVVATRAPGSLSEARILWIQVLCQAYWVVGGVTGALVGGLLPDVPGIGFALTALFAVLAIDAFSAHRDVPAPIIAGACALGAQLVAPDYMLVVAMTTFVVVLVARFALTSRREAPRA
ncbi:AzlC family ABC transporter permease [Sanguibacter hominis ATCC BAA-789]|uniref:AzlC family ABC transporter permease n=1 Tax=Sanguibacter hominis ATCC BAA-789 TaxID=1312740 RepID=A0A9X5FD37_9MICO|nr:AzlC family ABC transporter permease [Sanguibacter hominis]NKX92877.1 AzlC family ABC transporter permease [Sanguibacter hominis ATCC BAA-789]